MGREEQASTATVPLIVIRTGHKKLRSTLKCILFSPCKQCGTRFYYKSANYSNLTEIVHFSTLSQYHSNSYINYLQ
jgi:hypothetical protein